MSDALRSTGFGKQAKETQVEKEELMIGWLDVQNELRKMNYLE